MSTGRAWYKRYPGDFIGGTLQLSLEEKGAYSMCLDLMYERGGPIPDDPHWLARVCGCPLQRWKKIRARLTGLGKLNLTDDGRLANGRATYEMHRGEAEHQEKSARGKRGAAKKAAKKSQETSKKVGKNFAFFEDKPNENNDIVSSEPKQTQRLRVSGLSNDNPSPAAEPPEKPPVEVQPRSKPARVRPPKPERIKPEPKPKTPRQIFLDEMAPRLEAATGWSEQVCFKMLSRLLNDAAQSFATVEHALGRLEDVGPDDPGPFLFGAVASKLRRKPAFWEDGSGWEPGL